MLNIVIDTNVLFEGLTREGGAATLTEKHKIQQIHYLPPKRGLFQSNKKMKKVRIGHSCMDQFA
ncbi:hypothetical protein QUF58_08815 [Anaerolineales bacterium HSG24]|nr:hypothetical protein [Anaerolineales bacterium HSG24]